MPKVDWINWKTDPKEIINPAKVIEKLDEQYSYYNCYMNSVVYEGIKYEIANGGLDKNSFNIMGISPANDSAMKILNNIEDIKVSIEKILNNIYKQSEEQKRVEKQQLIEAIEKKIIEEEKALNNVINLKEKIKENNNVITHQELQDIIDITNEKINRLNDRLEKAKTI